MFGSRGTKSNLFGYLRVSGILVNLKKRQNRYLRKRGVKNHKFGNGQQSGIGPVLVSCDVNSENVS